MSEFNLHGRVALITGASRGFGLAVAERLLKEGASVALCGRDEATIQQAAERLSRADSQIQQRVFAMAANVAIDSDCKAFVKAAENRLGPTQILVNNAGVYGPMGTLEQIDIAAWQEALQINLMGSLQMAAAVLPGMKTRRHGKIIQLSGGGATSPLPGISAYAASKAAVVRLMETVAEEVRELGIDVNCVAPGALNTNMLKEVLAAGESKVGQGFFAKSLKQHEEGGTPLEVGAGLVAYLASAQSDGLTGKLISAVWDPWMQLSEHKQDLFKTDLYTLRRIVPKDRGLSW